MPDRTKVDDFVIRASRTGMRYGVRGVGQPIVLLHGWCLSRHLWIYQEEYLAARYQVITPDLPGFGESSSLAGPYDLDRYATALGDLLEELELENALLVGFAFGGAVAMALAAADPSRVGGLALIGVPSAAHGAYDRMPRAIRKDWPLFAERSAAAICKQPQSDATLRWLGTIFEGTPLPVALATVGVLGQFEPIALAPAIHVRTLFIHGADDDVVPAAVSEECAASMPHAQVAIVENSGHLVVLDQKERLNELVDEIAGVVSAAT
jgi:pimeloyl-ACP methyl ester carboxylesterase